MTVSSRYNATYFNPSLVVDGDDSTDLSKCTLTGSGQMEAWLTVDLQEVENIASVSFFRGGCNCFVFKAKISLTKQLYILCGIKNHCVKICVLFVYFSSSINVNENMIIAFVSSSFCLTKYIINTNIRHFSRT